MLFKSYQVKVHMSHLKGTTATAPAIFRMQGAADYLGISRAYLYLLVERGELLRVKLGVRAAGIRRSDLDQWVSTRAGA